MTSVASTWPAIVEAASAPYRSAGRFAWHFARGKLSRDPVFRHVLSLGLIAQRAQVLDIGCGQGLLANLLRGGAVVGGQGRWPTGWASVTLHSRVTGIELMQRDVDRARAALGADETIVCGDMCHTPFPHVDTVVKIDVLHYITVPEQDTVLAHVRAALPTGGRLVLRVGDAAARNRFGFSRWVESVVTFVRRHRIAQQFGRPQSAWVDKLESLGFDVHTEPMSRGTPFANVLMVARVRGGAAP